MEKQNGNKTQQHMALVDTSLAAQGFNNKTYQVTFCESKKAGVVQ